MHNTCTTEGGTLFSLTAKKIFLDLYQTRSVPLVQTPALDVRGNQGMDSSFYLPVSKGTPAELNSMHYQGRFQKLKINSSIISLS